MADPHQNICYCVLLCNVTKPSKEALAYPILCSDYFIVNNMLYLGTVNNNNIT